MPNDSGKTVTVGNGTVIRILVDDGYSWALQATDPNLLQVVDSRLFIGQTFRGVFLRAKTIRAGSTQVRAVGEPTCRNESPPCQEAPKLYQFTIVVQ